MSFNPNEPQNGDEVDADVLRNQFNALNDKITVIPVGPQGPAGAQGETGVAGADGATGPQGPPGQDGNTLPETDPIFAASAAAQFVSGDKAKLDSALQSIILTGHNVSELANDAGYYAGNGSAFATATQGAAADAAFHTISNPQSQQEVDSQPFDRPAALLGRVNGGMPITAGGLWGGISLGTPNGSNANICVVDNDINGGTRFSAYQSCHLVLSKSLS